MQRPILKHSNLKRLVKPIAGAIAGIAILIPLAHADSLQNMSDAVGDSAEAGARVVASGGQVIMGAVAVPLAAVGGLSEATGGAATQISSDLWDTANAPLVVDDAVMMEAQPLPQIDPQPQSQSQSSTPAKKDQ